MEKEEWHVYIYVCGRRRAEISSLEKRAEMQESASDLVHEYQKWQVGPMTLESAYCTSTDLICSFGSLPAVRTVN